MGKTLAYWYKILIIAVALWLVGGSVVGGSWVCWGRVGLCEVLGGVACVSGVSAAWVSSIVGHVVVGLVAAPHGVVVVGDLVLTLAVLVLDAVAGNQEQDGGDGSENHTDPAQDVRPAVAPCCVLRQNL